MLLSKHVHYQAFKDRSTHCDINILTACNWNEKLMHQTIKGDW